MGIGMGKRRTVFYLLLTALFLAFVPAAGRRAEAASAQTVAQNSVNMIRQAKKNKVSASEAKLVKKSGKLKLRYKNRKKSERYAKKEWVCYSGKIYYFNKKGNAATGFFKYNGKWYYADETCRVRYKHWVSVGGKSYYMKKDGTRAEDEEITSSKVTYKFNKNGVMVSAKGGSTFKYLFVGDSRTVGMKDAVTDSATGFIGQVSAGYSYLTSTAGPKVRSYLASNPNLTVIFNFGVNDLGNIGSYISYYKKLVAAYPRATFYFMSVNPCSGGYSHLNSWIKSFNSQLKNAFGSRYINTNNYMKKKGYTSWDGLHYSYDTYRMIYNYVIKKVG